MNVGLLSEKLRQAGYSITRQREVVFTMLKEHGALSMSHLIMLCSGQADRASVYRTVQLFEQLGFVRRIAQGWKHKIELSDVFSSHHHHIVCAQCGLMTDLNDDPRLKTVLKAMARPAGYKIINHELEIVGICVNCQHK